MRTLTLQHGVGTLLAVGCVLGALSGCATMPKQDPGAAVSCEVVKLICLYDQNPFVSFDEEGDLNVEGFRVTVVLASRKTGKGIAEDGVIRVKMYRIDRTPGSKPVRVLLREWPVNNAGLRTFKSPVFGEGYKLLFQWAKEDDVLGHDVQLVVSFERADGRVIRSQTKALKVPPAKDE